MTNVLAHVAALALMVAGVIWSNETVKKMARMLHVSFEVGVHSSKSDRKARAAIVGYRAKFGNGPLFTQFIAALVLIGLGGVGLIFVK